MSYPNNLLILHYNLILIKLFYFNKNNPFFKWLKDLLECKMKYYHNATKKRYDFKKKLDIKLSSRIIFS